AGVLRDGVPAFFTMIPVAALTYLASWTGWLRSDNAYDRNWAASNPSASWGWLPDWLRSLAEYHRSAYTFHNGLHSEHPYESNAWTWLFMGRPTSFYYHSEDAGQGACHAVNRCSEAVTVVGNPLIWWAASASLLVLIFCWAGRRDWRAGAILAGVAAGYLPWFLYPERTTFFFYAISFQPFLVLALTYTLGLALGRPTDPPWRRRQGALVVGLFVAAALLVSAFFLPVWTAELIDYDQWRWRMWMPSWI
ncbi:MAG: phospholipid carrier-dependent glycosyltransferase, partial [Arthrobacter sp.]